MNRDGHLDFAVTGLLHFLIGLSASSANVALRPLTQTVRTIRAQDGHISFAVLGLLHFLVCLSSSSSNVALRPQRP